MVVNIYYANYHLPPKHLTFLESLKIDVCRGRSIDLMNCEDPIHCQKGASLRMMNRDNSLNMKQSKPGAGSVTFTCEIVTILCSQQLPFFFFYRTLTFLAP